jgi:hypothetical protein
MGQNASAVAYQVSAMAAHHFVCRDVLAQNAMRFIEQSARQILAPCGPRRRAAGLSAQARLTAVGRLAASSVECLVEGGELRFSPVGGVLHHRERDSVSCGDADRRRAGARPSCE